MRSIDVLLGRRQVPVRRGREHGQGVQCRHWPPGVSPQ